jgi:hypothetical protein
MDNKIKQLQIDALILKNKDILLERYKEFYNKALEKYSLSSFLDRSKESFSFRDGVVECFNYFVTLLQENYNVSFSPSEQTSFNCIVMEKIIKNVIWENIEMD